MGVSWVYRLTKEQLVAELNRFQGDADGNVAELRQRLVTLVRANPDLFKNKPEDQEGYNEELDKTRDMEEAKKEAKVTPGTAANTHQVQQNTSTPNSNIHQPIFYVENDTAKILDQMRKWGCHFDGRDIHNFLERVQELQNAYQYTDEQILKGLPELLRGDALDWHRNEGHRFKTWAEWEFSLRNFYLSPGELRHLDRQISDRRQGPNEPIRKYVTSISTLMRRRGGISPETQLDNIYYNMKAELRLHIERDQIHSITDIIQRVEQKEETLKEMQRESKHLQTNKPVFDKTRVTYSSPKNIATITSAYDRRVCCWRCKQRGHDRFNCKNSPLKFCSRCCKAGIFTKDCNCPQTGNAQRVGAAEPKSRPPKRT